MTRHDVIVVGGGHNGLICAAYLARSGLDTLVVEARDSVGGCASTVDAMGVRVNVCNCDHLMIRATPIADELGLAGHGLEYLPVDPAYVALSWHGAPPWALYHDADETIEGLTHSRPSHAAAYARYLEDALPAARLVAEIGGEIPRPALLLRSLAKAGRRSAQTVLRWSRRSALDILSEYFNDETMVTPALTTGPVVWGMRPDNPGTGLAALGYAMRHVIQVGRPRGGSGALTDAILHTFEAAGGTVRCSAPVTAISRSGEVVDGVVIDGERLSADAVVGACDPVTIRLLLGDRVDRFVDSKDGYESKIDAVVDELPRYSALGDRLSEEVTGSTVVVSPSVNGMLLADRMRHQGRVAPHPMMLVNTPSAPDPSLAGGSGGHVLSLEVLWTPYALAEGWATTDEPQRWLDIYAGLVQPGFTASVRDWRVVTPLDYETDFGMRRGYAPSFPGTPIDAVIGRPKPLARYRTEYEGLYLTGAATYPGAGVWGAAGRNAARQIIADRQRRTSRGGWRRTA